MTTFEREMYEDAYGFTSHRCPRCHRSFWADGEIDGCPHCGYGAHADDEQEEDDDGQR